MVALAGPACSDWARSQDLAPVGSAGHYQGFLLVEQPLPWPHDIGELPELAQLSGLAQEAGARIQAVFPHLLPSDGLGTTGDERRLVYYRSPRPGWAAPLVRSEASARPGDLAAAAAGLMGAPAPTSEDGGGAGPTASGQPGPSGPEVVDVLICTHGRRDTCCGSMGTSLFSQLAARPRPAPGVRLWRTSHTGGHRFAPTALVLPSATLWAWADADLLDQVARGPRSLDDVLPRYRGCATVGPPGHQALEGAVIGQVGWGLLSVPRRSSEGPGGVVSLETEGFGHWEAVVRPGRRVPQPDCHTAPELAYKVNVEWVVEGLHRTV